MENALTTAVMLKILGYGIPGVMLALGFLSLQIMAKYNKTKQDKDRKEHMDKWNSMIKVQESAIQDQRESIDRIIDSHEKEINRIIDAHNVETERHGRLFERNTAAIEELAHQLSIQTQKLTEKTFCPRSDDDG